MQGVGDEGDRSTATASTARRAVAVSPRRAGRADDRGGDPARRRTSAPPTPALVSFPATGRCCTGAATPAKIIRRSMPPSPSISVSAAGCRRRAKRRSRSPRRLTGDLVAMTNHPGRFSVAAIARAFRLRPARGHQRLHRAGAGPAASGARPAADGRRRQPGSGRAARGAGPQVRGSASPDWFRAAPVGWR